MFRAYASAAPNRAATAIVICGLVLAYGACILPLIGWFARQPFLAGLGYPELQMGPLTSVGLLCSALALSGTLMRVRQRFALPLLLLAFIIGVASLIQDLAVSLGIDRVALEHAIGPDRAELSANTGLLGRAMMVLLPIAIALAGSRNVVAERIAGVIASLCMAFGALALLLVPNADLLTDADLPYLTTSLGSGIAITSLAITILARLGEAGWSGVLAARSPEWKVLQAIFPVILVAPVLVEVFEFAALNDDLLSPVMAQIAGAAFDVAVIAVVLFWTTTAVVRQRAALEELTRALDAAPIVLTKENGRILHWSRGCEDLYGWDASDAVGRFKHELLDSRALDPAGGKGVADCVSDRSRALVETRHDGGTVRVIEQVRRVEGIGRKPMLVLSMTDVSARLDAEAALRESQDRLSLALNSHDVGIFEWRTGGRGLTWSLGSEQRLGARPGDLSTWSRWSALADPGDRNAVLRKFKRVTRDRGDRFSFKYRLQRPGGATGVLEGSARCFYDEHGDLTRIVGVSIDVTDREEREAALYAREAQLRSILETVPDAMVVIDEKGFIRSFSRTAEQMFGYTAEQAIGMNVSVLTSGEHPAKHDQYLRHYLETGERKVIGHARMVTAVGADGTEIPVEVRVGEAHVGKERLFTGFMRDITERLESEERLSTLQAELAHASRVTAMGELAAGLAHELNQPLTAAVNFLGTARFLLKRGGDPSQVDSMVESASDQALRAGEIIRRLREFVAKREIAARYEPIEPAIREAAALVLTGQDQFGIRLVYEFDPKAEIMLADRIQVQQVLVNLLRNSVEALRVMPKESREIRLSTRALEDGMVEISVCDTGPGIPASVLSRMYQPFTSTKGDDGMGIGLSICRRIVQAHGGHLEAENRKTRGACFRFTLSSADQEEPRP